MSTALHPLIKDAPNLAQDLIDLCDDDPSFAARVAEYEQLAVRFAAVQAGTEKLNADDTQMLEQQCTALHAILMRKLTHPDGGCCGGCGG